MYKTFQVPLQWGLERVQRWFPGVSPMRLFTSKNLSAIALATQAVVGTEVEQKGFDVFKYVDPLIGTSEGGET
jgi:hypothetical protein